MPIPDLVNLGAGAAIAIVLLGLTVAGVTKLVQVMRSSSDASSPSAPALSHEALQHLVEHKGAVNARLDGHDQEISKVRERQHHQAAEIQRIMLEEQREHAETRRQIAGLTASLSRYAERVRYALLRKADGKEGADLVPPPEIGGPDDGARSP